MQALLRFAVFAGMVLLGVGMIRQALRPNAQRMARITQWLRGLTWANVALMLLWLIGLARH
jgi:hypothetical protein